MICDRIAYPYLDSSTGARKYDGFRVGDVECATVIVSANRSGIDIVVSVADDLGRQDGTAEFCRSYDSVCPVGMVAFTAPATSPGGTAFNHWTKDGVPQTMFDDQVQLDPCDNFCHALRAVYGANIPPPPQTSCYADVVIPDSALVKTTSIWTPLPCPPIVSGCPSNPGNFFPVACYNTLWGSWNFGEFEVDFRRFDADPEFFIHYSTHTGYPDPAGFESIQVCSPAVINIVPGDCHPNDIPGVTDCWCECEHGANCVTPIVECTIPPFCTGVCFPFPRQYGIKFWTNSWSCIFLMSCSCAASEVTIFWEVRATKSVCVRGNEGDCCYVCDPPGNPLCVCPCAIPGPLGSGFSLKAETSGFTGDPPQQVTGIRLPGESCADAMQRLFDSITGGGLHFERDEIVDLWPQSPTGCTMRVQQTIDVEF